MLVIVFWSCEVLSLLGRASFPLLAATDTPLDRRNTSAAAFRGCCVWIESRWPLNREVVE
jgi:hypothetical protein